MTGSRFVAGLTRILAGAVVIAAVAVLAVPAAAAAAPTVTALRASEASEPTSDTTDTSVAPCDPVTDAQCVSPAAPTAADDGLLSGWYASAQQAVFDQLAEWITAGARYTVGRLFGMIDDATRPELSARWFREHVAAMAQVAGGWLGLLFLAALIDAGVRRRTDALVRALFMLPAAAIATPVAMFVLDLAVAATDAGAAWMLQVSGDTLTAFSEGLIAGLLTGPTALPADGPDPGLALLLGAFLVQLGALVVWVELLMRDAVVYIAAMFLPLAFAGMVWPSTAHWAPRLLRLQGALIASKLTIVATLGLGGAIGAAGVGGDADEGGGLAMVVLAVGVLFVTAFTPFVLYRIVQVWEQATAAEYHGMLTGAAGRAAAPVAAGAGLAFAGRRMFSSVVPSSDGGGNP